MELLQLARSQRLRGPRISIESGPRLGVPGVAQLADLVLNNVGIAREERPNARAIILRGATASEPCDEAADRGTDPATERQLLRLDVRDEAVAERVNRFSIHARAKTYIEMEAELLELANVLLLAEPLLHPWYAR